MWNKEEWEESFWKAVEAGQSLDFADIEWYALDCRNSIAFFTTAGPGPIPRSVLRDRDEYNRVINFFAQLGTKGRAELVTTNHPNARDWVQASERGLYAFDYERGEGRLEGYYMVARPEAELRIDNVPNWVQKWLESVRLDHAVFADSLHSPIDPTRSKLACR
jgi:hypothetical protein